MFSISQTTDQIDSEFLNLPTENRALPPAPPIKSCFQANRYLLLALLHSTHAKTTGSPAGGAVILRVVHQLGRRGSEQPCGEAAVAQLATIELDPLATLSATYPLHEALMRWAPLPQATVGVERGQLSLKERAEIAIRSVVHLAIAPKVPGEPFLVLSINANGDCCSHMYFQTQWRRFEGQDIVVNALRYAHLQAFGLAIPDQSEALEDLHDQLRVRALAQRAAAITMGATSANDPFVVNVLPMMGAFGTPLEMGEDEGLVSVYSACTTPCEIMEHFSSVMVSSAITERMHHHKARPRDRGDWY